MEKQIMEKQLIWYYEMVPMFIKQKSFYGKARVEVDEENGTETLISYHSPVCRYIREKNEIVMIPYKSNSQTTRKHKREFIRQHGLNPSDYM